MKRSEIRIKIQKCFDSLWETKKDSSLEEDILLTFINLFLFLPKYLYWKVRYIFAESDRIKKKPIDL